MHGFAGFTQIYISVVRPAIYDCNYFWQYSSIATLTPNFLRSLEFNVQTTIYDDIPKVIRKKLEKDGWVVIFYSVSNRNEKSGLYTKTSLQDFFPTVMDLELALERTLAYEYLLLNAAKIKMHSLNRRILSIPGLLVPPYIIDFESVILGNCVEYTVNIVNYGPCSTTVKLLSKGKKDNRSKNKGKKKYETKAN